MIKMFEKIFKQIPLVDGHCHPFNPSKEGSYDFRLDFNLYHGGADEGMVKNSLASIKLIEGLGALLGITPDSDNTEEVISTRNKLYKENAGNYIKKLFEDVNFETLVLDTGYPHIEFGVESVTIEEFKKLIPRKAYEIFRIEPVLFKILKESNYSFDEALEYFSFSIDDAILNKKVIGLKTVIAYETGLSIKINSEKEVASAFKRYQAEKNKDDEKIIRDFFVVLSLKKCRQYDIPMQFHTGMGSVPILDLGKANPILMMDFLDNKDIKDNKIVLTHSGHPFERETGMLVGCFKNLFCDVSAISSYFGAGALKTAFLKLFELAPVNKIIFGTDGGIIPETYWLGAKYGKIDLASALKELIDSGWLSLNKTEDFIYMILNQNAKNLYNLP